MRKYHYLLCDDGGVSDWFGEILIQRGALFQHEYGVYKVVCYLDKNGEETEKRSKIEMVECQRQSK